MPQQVPPSNRSLQKAERTNLRYCSYWCVTPAQATWWKWRNRLCSQGTPLTRAFGSIWLPVLALGSCWILAKTSALALLCVYSCRWPCCLLLRVLSVRGSRSCWRYLNLLVAMKTPTIYLHAFHSLPAQNLHCPYNICPWDGSWGQISSANGRWKWPPGYLYWLVVAVLHLVSHWLRLVN